MESGTPSRGTGRAMSEENVVLTPLEGNPAGLPESVVAAGYMLSAQSDKRG
jgi:hypothetical protein